MEDNIQCPVIRNMKTEINASYEESNFLKKKVEFYQTENNFIPSMSMIKATPHPSMMLSHLHHHHHHHSTFPSYPPQIFKDSNYTRMFPPLGFNNISNPNSLIIQPPPSSQKQQKRQLPIPNLKLLENYEEPKNKKPKFDFSIKALTAKEDSSKDHGRRPLGLQNENIYNPPPSFNKFATGGTSPVVHHEDKENKDAYSPVNVKSRGRPSADLIEILKQKSMQSPHRYSCPICHRSFPRKKSLDTHRLTHSDVKPYPCDFPGCNRRFKQSGQLKTHLRLHTGEKPFRCTHPNCDSAFTHANRKCTQHPEYPLRRSSTEALSEDVLKNISNENSNNSENLQKVKQWFEKHFSNKEVPSNENKENIPPEENLTSIKLESTDEVNKITNHFDENNKRLLSAVALVELQMKNPLKRKANYSKLFTSESDF